MSDAGHLGGLRVDPDDPDVSPRDDSLELPPPAVDAQVSPGGAIAADKPPNGPMRSAFYPASTQGWVGSDSAGFLTQQPSAGLSTLSSGSEMMRQQLYVSGPLKGEEEELLDSMKPKGDSQTGSMTS